MTTIKTGLENPCDWRTFASSSLMHDLADKPRFFYAGAGVSMAAGLPSWGQLCRDVLSYQRHFEGLDIDPDDIELTDPRTNAKVLHDFAHEPDDNGWPILSSASNDTRGFGRAVLNNIMLRQNRSRDYFNKDDLTLHGKIWRSNCRGILTTNYDMLFEEAYTVAKLEHLGSLRSYRYTAGLLRYVLSNAHFVLKLHGDVNDLCSMVLDPWQAWDDTNLLSGHKGFELKQIYATIMKHCYMIFMGSGLSDRTFIELHTAWRQRKLTQKYLPVAFIQEKETAQIGENFRSAEFIDPKFRNAGTVDDIVFLVYQEHSEILTFMDQLLALDPRPIDPCIVEANDIYQAWKDEWQYLSNRSYRTAPWTIRGISN